MSSHLLSKNFRIRIYKTVGLSVVLYGHETWFLTLREEHELSVFENGAEESICTEEGRSDGRLEKLHNELRDLYTSPSKIRIFKLMRMRTAEHVAQMGEERNTYKL
jgi:hypothetical protein